MPIDPHPTPTPTSAHALTALLFWLVGLAVLFLPFLRSPASADPEGDDPGRLESETDIPFDEDVAAFEEDFDLPLGDLIADESAARFDLDSPGLHDSGLFDVSRLDAGHRAYKRHCLGCHGSTGDGAGPAARHLAPRPRNFRKGVFKFTSTPTGRPPLHADVLQTITRGLSGSSMPEFRLLSIETRRDLAEWVRYLSVRGSFEQLMLDIAWADEELPDPDEVAEIVTERWAEENVKAVYPPTQEPPRTAESIARGRELYLSTTGANCAACHGEGGEGDGPSAEEFRDDWGYPIAPRDLTTGVYRAGNMPADLYRSIATGVNGTPMPSYSDSIAPEDIWSLVHFVQSLREE